MRTKKLLSILLMVALILSLAISQGAPSLAATKVTVDRVVDGDTFVTYIDGEKTRIRMIGIDTPESAHSDESRNTKWGKKISKWIKKLQATAKKKPNRYTAERVENTFIVKENSHENILHRL